MTNKATDITIRSIVYPNKEYWDNIQKMANRMAFSEQKYGTIDESYPHKADAIACLLERVNKYMEDGNTEWLVDAANFALIETMRPSHKDAHFRATEAIESPGLRMRGE